MLVDEDGQMWPTCMATPGRLLLISKSCGVGIDAGDRTGTLYQARLVSRRGIHAYRGDRNTGNLVLVAGDNMSRS